MTEAQLCRTADGKIHLTSSAAGEGDITQFHTYCGEQVVSVPHDSITLQWKYGGNYNEEEKKHLANLERIQEDWLTGEICQKCRQIREKAERECFGLGWL
jgi:hypothetical protein